MQLRSSRRIASREGAHFLVEGRTLTTQDLSSMRAFGKDVFPNLRNGVPAFSCISLRVLLMSLLGSFKYRFESLLS